MNHRSLNSPISHFSRLSREASQKRGRGFTMVETLAVIVIIGTMAALAAPVFVRQMRDSRVNRAAMIVSEMHRVARMRAIGRGAAVMVRWDASQGLNGKGALYIFEALSVVAGATTNLPSPSCLSTNWIAGDPSNRQIDWMDAGSSLYSVAQIAFFQPAPGNAAATYAEICFTPRGSTWIRYAVGNAFTQLTGVPHFEVANIENTARAPRLVYIPPNGAARIAL